MLTAKNNSLSYFDPFREFDEIEKAFFGVPFGRRFPAHRAYGTDIRDEGDKYVLEADLPGFDKEDIKVDVRDGVMEIKAERHSEHENKDEKSKYVCRERSYGVFRRTYDLTGIDPDAISAKYADGVLTLDLPKLAPAVPESRRINIE